MINKCVWSNDKQFSRLGEKEERKSKEIYTIKSQYLEMVKLKVLTD